MDPVALDDELRELAADFLNDVRASIVAGSQEWMRTGQASGASAKLWGSK